MRGGVADYTRFVARTLTLVGAQPSIITSARVRARLGDKWQDEDIPIFPEIRSWTVAALPAIAAIVEGMGAEVLNIQYQAGAFDLNPAVNLAPLYLRSRLPKVKVVTTFHDLKEPYILPKIGRLRHLATWLLALTSTAVIVTNQEDFVRLASRRSDGRPGVRFGGPALHPIPIGSNIPVRDRATYDRATWRRLMGVEPDEALFGYFGFLNPSKGLDDLIEAFARVSSSGIKAKLAMIGGSTSASSRLEREYAHYLRSRLDEPTFRSKVIWTGYTTAEEVSGNLLALDACVLPYKEGASIRHGTLVAAITHHAPIITTRPVSAGVTSSLPRLIDRENVLFTPAGSPDRLASAMTEIAQSPELRERLAAGLAGIASEFRWDAIVLKTLRVYQEVLNQGASA